MRFKSLKQHGYTIFAVSGTDVVSFGIDFTGGADTSGLLGFAVERHDFTDGEKYFMRGFKVFKDLIPDPAENMLVSTFEFPVQSFVWDDFTVHSGYSYEYFFYPVKGKPKNLRREKPFSIKVNTETLYTNKQHDVFFNRGVASSQEYSRRFRNQRPDSIADPKLRVEAYQWLSRNLDDALYKFIDRTGKGDKLYGCFYEFHYLPVLKRIKEAIDRGGQVKLIIDCKNNESTDKNGIFHESYPKELNLKALKQAGIGEKYIIRRTANKNMIAHNKFLIFQPKNSETPTEVWTGSTNISEGGIHGQTNVGHWIKNKATAASYKKYWELISKDPGIKGSSENPRADNKQFRQAVEALGADVTFTEITGSSKKIIPVFSPRPGKQMLGTYFELVDQASGCACITLAFGVHKELKNKLLNNNFENAVVFMLLEKKDAPPAKSKEKDTFVRLKAAQNVYEAYGSYIRDPLYQWTKEANTLHLKLNSHVKYIHTKFLLHDPMGPEPIIVTGSANFSDNSVHANDENMVIIKGDQRAADIYFTEFNRLFNHYYYRSVLTEIKLKGGKPSDDSLFLISDDSWLDKYKPGKLRMKRLDIFRKMEGTEIL